MKLCKEINKCVSKLVDNYTTIST